VRGDLEYLEFISESIQLVNEYTRAGRDHFLAEVGNQDQVLRRMEVLADAAGKLSKETRAAHPEIEWDAITGFRNRMAHGYIDVNLELVWDAVQRLPALQRAVNDELAQYKLRPS
jgi:uncharacterized protein with HEPN domain